MHQFRVRPYAVAFLLVFAGPVRASDDPGRDIASIREWALAHNAELAATAIDARASHTRILPAGALPDPVLALTIRDIDPDAPWRSPGRENGNLLEVRQTVPLWGKRELAREIARAEAGAADAERDATARRLIASVEAAYARYWEAIEAVEAIDRRIALMSQVEAIARGRYGLGEAPQQDSIRARVRQTELRGDRLERQAALADASAMLNVAMGRAADAPLAEPASPPELAVRWTSLSEAVRALDAGNQPELAGQSAMVRAADRAAELQRRQRRPDLTFGLGAMQQGKGIESLEVMVEVEIPFQQSARRAREAEADLRSEAARLRESAARTDLEGRLASALAQWAGARERRRLAETTQRVQSDANFQSALAGYQAGAVDFATVLDALDAWQQADLARLAAHRDELIAAASVRAIEGSQP